MSSPANFQELLEFIEVCQPMPDQYRRYLADVVMEKIHPRRRRDALIREWAALEPGGAWQKATRLSEFVRLIEQNYKLHTVPDVIRRAYAIRRIPATVQYICDSILTKKNCS